jgi:hypothetical protein
MADSVEEGSSLAEGPQESRSSSRGEALWRRGAAAEGLQMHQSRLDRWQKVGSDCDEQSGDRRGRGRGLRGGRCSAVVWKLCGRGTMSAALHFRENGLAAVVSPSPSISIALPSIWDGCGTADHGGVRVVCAT